MKRDLRKIRLAACRWLGLIALLAPAGTRAQVDPGTPVISARTYHLTSTALGETRSIEVSLPAGYDASPGVRYPVLVVLDGEFEGTPAAAVARFYAGTGELPAMIVVAVRNTQRTRDLTPAPVAGFVPLPGTGQSGGAEAFLRFLEGELMPWVDGRYRTAPMRILVGHSLGGLFALHALAIRPQLFTGYVVMEPATWWNNGRELIDAGAALRRPTARNDRVMMVNTESLNVDTTGHGGDAPMVRYLRVTGEDHSSMALEGIIHGLRTMLADFQPPRWAPGQAPVAMLEYYDTLSHRLGFTVPVPAPVFEEVILMSAMARRFQDADQVLDRFERERGRTDDTRQLRQLVGEERAAPAPAGLVPLVIPAHRPSPREAQAFLGRWTLDGAGAGHEVEIRASGDTLLVHEREQLPDAEWVEDDVPVIGLTPDGGFEWGQRVFRGIAALLVLHARIQADGTMVVTREVRGWVPRGPVGDMLRTERLHRVGP